jgi:hypothetical protein
MHALRTSRHLLQLLPKLLRFGQPTIRCCWPAMIIPASICTGVRVNLWQIPLVDLCPATRFSKRRAKLEIGNRSAGTLEPPGEFHLRVQDHNSKNAIPKVLGIAFLNSGQAGAAGTELLVPRTARTYGKCCTSATNLASKGEVLSFLNTTVNARGMFGS